MKLLFFPVKTITDLDSLNSDEIVKGYLLGLHGEPEPTESRALWHGWRNGLTDSGRMEKDKSQKQLAHEYYTLKKL